jgi:hypothetical protein
MPTPWKVKIFTDNKIDGLETKINDFLTANPGYLCASVSITYAKKYIGICLYK